MKAGADWVQKFHVNTGGLRNENGLTQDQIEKAVAFAVDLGMPREQIAYSIVYTTGYNPDFDILLIGTDLYPMKNALNDTKTANSRVSWKSGIAHELVGHREAALKGWTQDNPIYEEVQASIRAARFTPGLSEIEKITLLRDAISRLPGEVKIMDIKDILNISER
jgi:hypothetical protein